jgi:hypothetical protein
MVNPTVNFRYNSYQNNNVNINNFSILKLINRMILSLQYNIIILINLPQIVLIF